MVGGHPVSVLRGQTAALSQNHHGQFCSSGTARRTGRSRSGWRSNGCIRPTVRCALPFRRHEGSGGSPRILQTDVDRRDRLDSVFIPLSSIDVSLYPIPDMSEPPVAASELLNLLAAEFHGMAGSSPEMVAAEPFEYEISCQPLPPSGVASGPHYQSSAGRTGDRGWSYLGPRYRTSTSRWFCQRGMTSRSWSFAIQRLASPQSRCARPDVSACRSQPA